MLHRLYLTMDIHYIVNIKLPLQLLQDRIMCYFDHIGEYYFKSGYYVSQAWKNLSSAATSAGSSHLWSSGN